MEASTPFPAPSQAEGNMMRFNAFSSQGVKRPNLDIFYTEINWQGITGPGQVASRAKFCRDMRIQPKDMRSLESNFSGLTISVRGESIIINTDGFRALINPESVAMLNDPLVAYKEYQHLPVIKSSNEGLAFSRRQEFISNLLKGISRLNGIQRRAKKGEKSAYDIEYSFDLLALGSILDVIFGSLEEELHILKAAVRALLSTLDREISSKIMERLLQSTHQLQDFVARCATLQNSLDKISEQGKKTFQSRLSPDSQKTFLGQQEEEQAWNDTHQADLATLVEQYSAQEMIEEVGVMARHLQMKEDTANLKINTAQIDLVYVGLKLEVLTVGVTLGALLTGAFGMNLKNGIEETDYAFAVAAAVILGVCCASVLVGWLCIRRIGRNL
ncbi:hypothetical protein Pst134EA_007442 [Puccinia striiformis f. sp. tritici]|uniref:Magnesium transporter n=1 Tax=Puccinia striiformis f. sp. tritici PST-78 TaxID=1165861 RepID=A0A0L0UVB0_9BASI|nr:hypothetical protein Pst134EA_007442 [Puccinia striiformis f. sp. tritici]KAH9460391.1 hypothetical protein Pst134EB_008565 [Puccinia striiformis f. sp. tritici]KAH9470177.1 hypothetical protein Pst134EA_007442 [Puccinia striiformis f. sp. tritici]KNE90886.1 hypothetical protein PSTG_15676 [Puccinia striiformis f. sp. tritici PST-78]